MAPSTNQVTLATSIISAAQQTINNYCSITCNNNFTNSTITIVGGDAQINIDQTCTNIGSECTIKNLVSSEITNLIENIVEQTQSNLGILSLLGPSSSNSTTIGNAIKNQISQLINNTCNQNTTNNINGVNIFAIDADTRLNYNQTGTMDHATCALDTVAKIVLNNAVSNDVKQSISSCGNVLTILIIVGVIIVGIILLPVITRLFGGVAGGAAGGAGKSKVEVSGGGGGAPTIIQEQAAPQTQGAPPPPPQSPGFYDRLKGYGNRISNFSSNTYQGIKNRFTTPTSLQASGLSQVQVYQPVEAQVNPFHRSSLTVDKMLKFKQDVPGFMDAAYGLMGTTACSDGNPNLRCPPIQGVDRALNRLYDTYYVKQ